MSVHFTFNAKGKATGGGALYSYVGSGTMKLTETPPARTVTQAARGSSTIVIRRAGGSATFKVHSTGYNYLYNLVTGGGLRQTVRRYGDTTRSTIRGCRLGPGQLSLVEDPRGPPRVFGRVCGAPIDGRGTVRIVPVPKPAKLPSELTLTVNGVSCSAE